MNGGVTIDPPTTARVSCDSVVARGTATATGHTVFAKNSDRPALECQPLAQVASADHEAGSALHCQYVEIEQVAHTHAFVGAQPSWCWGLEHGLNEKGVAVGNHSIFTREAVAETGLLGMDLVRLALERADSAERAVGVISELLERHEQGGSGYEEGSFAYHNSFLLADAQAAFLLEASGGHWALREVGVQAAASNHVTTGSDWTRLSDGCEDFAREQGWWQGDERFDFAAAYRDSSLVPEFISSGRYGATCRVLGSADGSFDSLSARRLLRDHNGSEWHRPVEDPEDERAYSVCMHADPIGTTTASMVVELSEQAAPLLWAAPGSPCTSPYLPLFAAAPLPALLRQGTSDRASGGLWWTLKALLEAVEKDFVAHAPMVRRRWQEFEDGLDARAAVLSAAGQHDTEALVAFMEESARACDQTARQLLAEIS
ncbi:MAG: hypothetical protein H8E45_00345 [Proteobacteria bacterium]|nr:hypothetical protein [Pseudomonadota bacterium]